MITITDKKEIKNIIKILYDINQIYKNIYQSRDYYIIDNGLVYSCNKEQFPQIVLSNILNIKTDFFDNKKFLIKSKEFFDFDPKKINKTTREIEINKIEYDEDTYNINFIREPIKLKFEFNDNYNMEKELDHYINIIDKNFEESSIQFNFNKGVLYNIKKIDKNNPHILELNYKDKKVYLKDNDNNINGYKFLINDKFIIGNDSKEKKDKEKNIIDIIENEAYIELFKNKNPSDSIDCINLIIINNFLQIEQYYFSVKLD